MGFSKNFEKLIVVLVLALNIDRMLRTISCWIDGRTNQWQRQGYCPVAQPRANSVWREPSRPQIWCQVERRWKCFPTFHDSLLLIVYLVDSSCDYREGIHFSQSCIQGVGPSFTDALLWWFPVKIKEETKLGSARIFVASRCSGKIQAAMVGGWNCGGAASWWTPATTPLATRITVNGCLFEMPKNRCYLLPCHWWLLSL